MAEKSKTSTRKPAKAAAEVPAPAPIKKERVVVANDPSELKPQLKEIGGSQSDHWNNILANQASSSLWLKHSTPEQTDKQLSATVAALIGIGPRDEIEGMLAAQMLAAHNAAIECYRRAMLPEQTLEGRNINLGQANKLSRTYTTLVEALNRHRGKGQQKVTVEHVHVHAGGQAVVGMVATPDHLGGGGLVKSGELPHAKRQISHEPQPALPCSDPVRDALPIPGNA